MAVIERPELHQDEFPVIDADKPDGPVAAALIAGGIGAAAVGFFTTLAEANSGAKSWLEWNAAVGSLSGITSMAVVVWLVAWAGLHRVSKVRPVEFRTAFIVTLVLVGMAAVGTFPTFFQAFAAD
jgi:hypothetical protein